MKFKRGDLSMYLGFILLLTMFFACSIAFLYNNKLQQERSSLIDYANQQSMVLQSKISGYSTNSEYCFMYDSSSSGNKLSQTSAKNIVKKAEDDYTSAIKTFIQTKTPHLNFTKIDFKIDDSDNVKDIATIHAAIYYYGTFRTPYVTSGSSSTSSSRKTLDISYKEDVTREIENPRRYRNIK